MRNIKIIALDLDGTLLNSDKKLTKRNFDALQRAAQMGVEIVPTTGRFFDGMPECIRKLPFVHYAITINGAAVFDIRTNQNIIRAEIPSEQAIQIMQFLDALPVIYDCFMDNRGWMTASLQRKASEFAPDVHYLKMLLELRKSVPELKAFVREYGLDVQKIQFFVKDMTLRRRLIDNLQVQFKNVIVSSSVINNVEINHFNANKGEAIRKLAAHLHTDISNTIAFGDGLNDLSMIREAGIGIAMKNACPEVLQVADAVTESCDRNGVALAIEKLLF